MVYKNKIMDMAKYFTGLGCISIKKIESLNISTPSIEKQNEIVTYCDFLMNSIETNKNIIQKNKEL